MSGSEYIEFNKAKQIPLYSGRNQNFWCAGEGEQKRERGFFGGRGGEEGDGRKERFIPREEDNNDGNDSIIKSTTHKKITHSKSSISSLSFVF